jgi:hypothetical protein
MELVQLLERRHKHRLCHVAGVLHAPTPPPNEAIDARLMPAHEFLKRNETTPPALPDEFLVSHCRFNRHRLLSNLSRDSLSSCRYTVGQASRLSSDFQLVAKAVAAPLPDR